MLVKTPKPALKLLFLPSLLVASLALSACQKDAVNTEDNMSDTDEVGTVTEVVENDSAQNEASLISDASANSELNADELSRYRWKLFSATDTTKQPVSTLMNIKDQVSLSFNQYQGQNTLSYSVGCNMISAGYELKGQTLLAEDGMSTKMSCGELDSAETQLNKLMQGSSELQLAAGEMPTLTQITSDAATLVWKGRMTAKAKYNSKGETIFWAVNSQKVPCEENSSQQCLQVKPITYDDQGIKSSEGKWEAFKGEIEGYQFDGKHDEVLRLQRYQLEGGETADEEYAYVLDAVIESAVAK